MKILEALNHKNQTYRKQNINKELDSIGIINLISKPTVLITTTIVLYSIS